MTDSLDTTTIFAHLARQIPGEYVDLLIEELRPREGEKVVELGCGSGELAIRIAGRGLQLDAIDQSPIMIQTARTNYSGPLISWYDTSVDAFLERRHASYAGMYAMEAFHLFPNPRKLMAQIRGALRPGGALVIAWRIAEWEAPCAPTVPAIFAKYGAIFPDWSYSMCPDLPDWLGPGWLTPVTRVVLAESRSSAQEVIDFLCAIEMASRVDSGRFDLFREEITQAVNALAGDSGEFEGLTRFGLTICRRDLRLAQGKIVTTSRCTWADQREQLSGTQRQLVLIR